MEISLMINIITKKYKIKHIILDYNNNILNTMNMTRLYLFWFLVHYNVKVYHKMNEYQLVKLV